MKKPWLTRFLIGATLALLVMFLCLVWGVKRPSSRLPNGTELSLLSVTCGPTNVFFPGGIRDWFVYHLTPAKGINFWRVKIGPVSPMLDDWRQQNGSPAFPHRAVLWLGHSGPSNAPALPVPEQKWFSQIRATLADETGEEWEMRTGTAITRPAVVPGLNFVSSWDFTAFPRRGKRLRFRMYQYQQQGDWQTLADFRLPNPTPGPYPHWKAAALPAGQTNGDLKVRLTGLISGVKAVQYLSGPRQFTRASFEAAQNGQATDSWRADQLEATDATGNEPWPGIISYGVTNNSIYYEIQGTSLSPSEVWRLRVRFVKETDSNPNLTWTSPALAIEEGALVPASFRTNFQTFQLSLDSSQTPFHNTIRLHLDPPANDQRVALTRIVDDQGRKAQYESGGFEDFGFDAQWSLPAGAKWVKVTFHLVEIRKFQFVVQPTRQ